MKRLAAVQVLRAAAALMVVLFHACQWSGVDFAVGAAGVDLFFVISGFVLWASAEQRPPTPSEFLLARLRRVAPLYWIVTLAVFTLALWRPQALPIVHPQVRHLILSLLFAPHADPTGAPFPMLPPGWTLVYEAFFYIAFALALAAPRDRRLQVLAGLLGAAALIGFGYHGWYTLLANPLLLEFLGGVGLARLWTRGALLRRGRRGRPQGWFCILAGAAVLLALQVLGVRDDFWRPLLWGPPAVLIAAGALLLQAGGRVGEGLATRALQGLGDASYSLYLVQAPVIAAFAWATPGLAAPLRIVGGVGLALAAGLACHRLVERPLMALLGAPGPKGAPGQPAAAGPEAGATASPRSAQPDARPAGARW
jgi:exopolysaccharide production protein ExoZ